MVREGYITEQACVARKRELPIVLEKLELVFRFYEENGRLPETNLQDKEEHRLYNFFRKLDLSKYINDIDPKIIKKIDRIKKENEIRKKKRKTKKFVQTRRNYITKCIDNYYNFYINNGFFPSDTSSNKLERTISKEFVGIVKFSKYYTKEHQYKIDNIKQIKKYKRKKDKLQKIQNYIHFCKRYDRVPKHVDKDSKDKTYLDRRETNIAEQISRIDLENVVIPYNLLENLYNEIDRCQILAHEVWVRELNELMRRVLLFMHEHNTTLDNKNLSEKKIKGIEGYDVLISNALDYVKKNIKFVDEELIKEYNSFSFLRKNIEDNNIVKKNSVK